MRAARAIRDDEKCGCTVALGCRDASIVICPLPEIDAMQTIQTTSYPCAELRRAVLLIQRIEWVSGIGQDAAEPVVLAEACELASRCPRVANCPLTAAE